MNPLNQPTVSRSEFRRALNLHCHKELGVGYSDLPDIITIDDNWWPEQSTKEALIMIESCIQELKDELSFTTNKEPLYDINE